MKKLRKWHENHDMRIRLLKREGLWWRGRLNSNGWPELDTDGRPLFRAWVDVPKKHGGGRVHLTFRYEGDEWVKIHQEKLGD